MPRLVVRAPDGTTQTVDLSENPIRLGRAEECEVILRNDAEVSRGHAKVWLDGDGQVLVADTNSKNGTRVDSGPTFRNETFPATQSIRIGEHEIQIVGAKSGHTNDSKLVEFSPDGPDNLEHTRFFPSSRRLDLNRQRLNLLMNLAERIGGTIERKQLLEQAIDGCCEALEFERALIVLKTGRGDTELPVARNIPRDESGAYKVSRTIINRALVHGERAVVSNPETDISNFTDSMVRYPICSALCVPILNRGEILGVIYGDRVTNASTYTNADVDFLAAIAQQVGVGLANLRLFQEHVRSQKVYAELERARAIQRDLFPSAALRQQNVIIDGYNKASSMVSGDYYDYFPLGEEQIGFIIADVTGHGLAAALVMANLQAAVRVALTVDTPLPDLAARLNRHVCKNTASNVFITAAFGRIRPRLGVIEYVNAGHPGPVVAVRGEARLHDKPGSLPLGIRPNEQFKAQRVEATADDTCMLFYTDGLIEAAGPDEQLMGIGPVVSAIAGLTEFDAQALIRCTLNTIDDHRGGKAVDDDLTLVAMQFLAGDATPAASDIARHAGQT